MVIVQMIGERMALSPVTAPSSPMRNKFLFSMSNSGLKELHRYRTKTFLIPFLFLILFYLCKSKEKIYKTNFDQFDFINIVIAVFQ